MATENNLKLVRFKKLKKNSFLSSDQIFSLHADSPFPIIPAANLLINTLGSSPGLPSLPETWRTHGQPVTIRQSDTLYKYIFTEVGQK